MNEKTTQITNKRKITEDFEPVWEFSGTIYFEKPLSDENRQQATEIIDALNKILARTE